MDSIKSRCNIYLQVLTSFNVVYDILIQLWSIPDFSYAFVDHMYFAFVRETCKHILRHMIGWVK